MRNDQLLQSFNKYIQGAYCPFSHAMFLHCRSQAGVLLYGEQGAVNFFGRKEGGAIDFKAMLVLLRQRRSPHDRDRNKETVIAYTIFKY